MAASRWTGAGPNADPRESACGPPQDRLAARSRIDRDFSVEFRLGRDGRSVAASVLWRVAGWLSSASLTRSRRGVR